MKVIFFNSARAWGGGEKWHLESAAALSRRGFEAVVAAHPKGELMERSRRLGLPVMPAPVGNLSFLCPVAMRRLGASLRAERADAIVLNLPADLKAAGLAAKRAGIERIIYRRGSAIPIRDTALNRYLFRRVVAGVIANSEETKRTVNGRNPRMFPPEKIRVIYNGLDASLYERPAAEAAALRGRPAVLGNLGRLVPQKNQRFLIEVASILARHGVPFRMVIGGDGPLKNELASLAASSGVSERIELAGRVDDAPAFMHSIDVFLLPSLWEGFGYVIAEAMLCGKPVVAFDLSSNPELIEHGSDGFLSPPNDAPAFAEYAATLARDGALRASMGEKGRRKAIERFSIERSADELAQYLESV